MISFVLKERIANVPRSLLWCHSEQVNEDTRVIRRVRPDPRVASLGQKAGEGSKVLLVSSEDVMAMACSPLIPRLLVSPGFRSSFDKISAQMIAARRMNPTNSPEAEMTSRLLIRCLLKRLATC